MSAKRIYLDYNSTTPIHPDIQKKISKWLKNWGNPSNSYHEGRSAKEIIESTRYTCAKFLKSSPENIIFTSSGTEANNLFLKSFLFDQLKSGKKNHLITSQIEHSCVLNTARFCEEMGMNVSYIAPQKNGIINPSDIEKAITENTVCVSIMTANNETGAIQPIYEIGQICKRFSITFHTDCVQGAGKLELESVLRAVDALTLSSHKLHTLKGCGVLMTKAPHALNKLIHGGAQEAQYRAGTENTLAIAALEPAIERILNAPTYLSNPLVLKHLTSRIITEFPSCTINTPENNIGNTLNVSFPGNSAESTVMAMDLNGISISTGSACSTGSVEPSHVLTAMGIDGDHLNSAIRFSIGPETSTNDCDQAINTLKHIIKQA
jgi:cysteine desulfurase